LAEHDAAWSADRPPSKHETATARRGYGLGRACSRNALGRVSALALQPIPSVTQTAQPVHRPDGRATGRVVRYAHIVLMRQKDRGSPRENLGYRRLQERN
jgi:hypothetical protein